jgi:hypothetical protein
VSLSRLKQGFDSPWERHPDSYNSVFLFVFANFPKLSGAVWGKFVRSMFVKLHHGALSPAPTIGFSRVSLGLGQRGVTERGHNLVRRAFRVGHEAAERFA